MLIYSYKQKGDDTIKKAVVLTYREIYALETLKRIYADEQILPNEEEVADLIETNINDFIDLQLYIDGADIDSDDTETSVERFNNIYDILNNSANVIEGEEFYLAYDVRAEYDDSKYRNYLKQSTTLELEKATKEKVLSDSEFWLDRYTAYKLEASELFNVVRCMKEKYINDN